MCNKSFCDLLKIAQQFIADDGDKKNTDAEAQPNPNRLN